MGRDHVTDRARSRSMPTTGSSACVVETTANMGAYNSLFAPFIPTGAALKVLPGVYDVKSLVYRVKGVLTNTTPVDAYRGAGRPESIYLMERLMDAAAREVGLDPAEFRRRNLIEARRDAVQDSRPARPTIRASSRGSWTRRWRRPTGRASSSAAPRPRGAAGGAASACRYYIESTMGDP